jgi:ketosteroid isomerase-like protein
MTERAPDHDEIVRVVQLYVDGFNNCDVNKFKEAFDPDAWIFYTDADGVLHKILISECFEPWAAPPAGKVVSRFIEVTQAGDVAWVLLGFDDESDPSDATRKHIGSWVDHHSLLRVKGVWKITNKSATHHTRAAWAAKSQTSPAAALAHVSG